MTTTATAQRGQGGAPLEARIVTRTAPHYRDVVGLYRRAFPRQEQIPLWHMRLMALLPGVALNAWYDGQTMAGLTYTVESRRMIWLFYLAVNDSVRSRGYGSQMLSQLRRRAAGRAIILEIEPLDPAAPNIEQRRRRLAFYERNGFSPTGHTIQEGEQSYTLMSDLPFDAGAFYRMVRRFSLGIEQVRLLQGPPPSR